MASVYGAEKETWCRGDRCLAPDPSGTLREATIQRLVTSQNNDTETMAWVRVTNHSKDGEEEEEAVPISKLIRPSVNQIADEKPQFPNSITDHRLCVPLELSDVDGHRVPYTINRYLRDYQREGIRFMYHNYRCSRGCILGDDMGLGKTVQVIALLAALLHKTGTWEDIQNNRPQFLQSQVPLKQSKPKKVFLIVAPLSVLYNWKDELETWGHFQCVVVHGLRKEEELARIKKGRTEIALTTYETLRLCLEEFNSIDWFAVVVDEAHKIKNPNSQITQAMKDLKCKVRIGLTGTILQNNLEELWCVMDWAIPGCLGSIGHFKNRFSDPIEQGLRHSATKRTLATGRRTVKALVRQISRWFLRRTKTLIKEQLPKKDDRVVFCSLTDFQQSVYQTVLDTEDVKLLLRSSEKCDCQSGRTRRSCCYKKEESPEAPLGNPLSKYFSKTNSEGVKIKELYFIYLAILRKAANNVALLQSTAGTSKKQEMYVAAICAKVFQKFPDFVQRCKDEAFEALSDPKYSGKMKVLQKLLKYYLQKKDKVLLFSLSTKLLDVLENYCMAEGLDYSRLDGTTKAKERVQIVKEFNSSSHVNLCLVSTMAGGLGLNFVGANVVVLFDPTWNPANDLQAIDRAYRIGQCRDVTVLRLISLGTIEEIIYLRQVYKQQLQSTVVGKESARRYFEAVQGQGDHKGELFGIKNLFRMQVNGTCLTRKILEREGQVEAGVVTTSVHKSEEKTEGIADSPKEGPAPDEEPGKKAGDGLQVSGGVLDFSSGSEGDEDEKAIKRKTAKPGAVDGSSGGNVAPSPGRLSLLQHGFSKLLESMKRKPEEGDGDSSSDVEENASEEESEDEKRKATTSSTVCNKGNSKGCLPKVGTKTWNISSGSDTDDRDNKEAETKKKASLIRQSDEAVRRQGLKGPINKQPNKKPAEEEGESGRPDTKKPGTLYRTALKTRCFENYSDESEDLDIEIMTKPKNNTVDLRCEVRDKQRERLDPNRRRQSVRKKSRYSEDIEMFTSSEDEGTPVKKARPAGCNFTCPKNTETPEKQGGRSKAAPFTGLKTQTSPAFKGKERTIDSVLGSVQEVMYTHSNQRVVGGSKAEELISRAAVRDVFERKMYSQLPANHILTPNMESLPASTPDIQPPSTTVRLEKPSVDYPVTFARKSVHHTRHTTFIIGETPQAICRQQLEEMAQKFSFPSGHHFAAEILRRPSAQRVTWLREYYTSLNHPDLSTTVTNNFLQLHSAQTSTSSSSPFRSDATKTASTGSYTRTPKMDVYKAQKNPKTYLEVKSKPQTLQHPKSCVQKPQKNQKMSRQNILQPPSHESEGQEEMVCGARGHNSTKRGSVSGAGAVRAAGGLGYDRASSSGLGSGEAAAFRDCADRDTPSSSDVTRGRSATLSKPAGQGLEQEPKLSSKTSENFQGRRENPQAPSPAEQAAPASSQQSFLTDLIGDTSILDDLLKPKSRSAQQTQSSASEKKKCLTKASSSRNMFNTDSGSAERLEFVASPKPNTPTAQQAPSKGRRKDFWDILNEGNEESINRLTDPAEVRKACVNTKFAAGGRSAEAEHRSLWKTNENFLWKK